MLKLYKIQIGGKNQLRKFEYARKVVGKDNEDNPLFVVEEDGEAKAYDKAKFPEYATTYSAGADFFCAEEVVIPSILNKVLKQGIVNKSKDATGWDAVFAANQELTWDKIFSAEEVSVKPTLVHTGIKACMEEDEVLHLYNRSSNPAKLGLVLANGVGVVDADYYNNSDNDGEIMFAFYNLSGQDVTLHVGDKLGQGVFQKYLRPDDAVICDEERNGGFGSTDK